MNWEFKPAGKTFQAFQKDWDALNQARNNHILLDSGFVAPLLRHFDDGRVVLAANLDLSERGLALLIRKGLGRWETFQPSQAPIGLILLGDLNHEGRGLVHLTRMLPGYALQLSVLQQDPDYPCFVPSINSDKNQFQHMEYIRTARITLRGTFDKYWAARGTNLRHNLARRRRRLIEKGQTPELVVRMNPGEVAEAIRSFGQLESRGWKAAEGTAVDEGNAQGHFYKEIFENFCDRGEGRIYQLLINGKVAASDLCLVRNGMVVVLKTAYDEEFNDFSPALQMREEILRQLFADPQIRVVEFYGRVMDWHTRWTDEIRTLFHVNCFRHPWVVSLKKLTGRFA